MMEVYLLDTNAFFNIIKFASSNNYSDELKDVINKIKTSSCYISSVSHLEIISVIGKYARGGSGANNKRMKPQAVKQWLKLVEDLVSGRSPLLSLSTLSFSEKTINDAKTIIQHSRLHNFGSLDAIIAATAKECCCNEGCENTTLITSDKGLKACLHICGIPCWDAFQTCNSTPKA